MASPSFTSGSSSMAGPGLHTERVLENEETCIRHRLFHIALVPSQKPLQYIVTQMVMGKKPNETLIDYFDRTRPKTVKFPKTQKESIISDPSCGSFDVTLCFKIIQEYCDKVKDKNDPVWITQDDTLEYYIKSIKDKRNDFIHNAYKGNRAMFSKIVHDVKDLLKKTWEKIGQTFGTDTSVNILEMEADIKKIKEAPFEDIRVHFSELKTTMITEGVTSMKDNYVICLSHIPDVHLLDKKMGACSQIKVLEVFTEMQIIYEEESENITMDECLIELEKRHDKKNKTSQFLLVDGVVGVGKTTLCRKLVLDWACESSTILGLSDFQLLIFMQFRDKHINSLSLLLTSVMPHMREKVDPEYLMMLTEDYKIMFVCDGLDENNPQSMQVFKEILSYGQNKPITVVCTTRPNEIENLRLILPAQFSYLRLQVLGIPEKRRYAFVESYLKTQKPDADPQSMLDYLNRTSTRMQEHLRFPFNLMCLTMIWIVDPGRVNSLMTATELFMVTLKEMKIKLENRQLEKGAETSELKEAIDCLLDKLYDIALLNHRSGHILLTEDALQTLKNECSRLKLTWRDVSSTFFTQTVSWLDDKESLFSFPHNGLQDFYAAMSILKKIEDHRPDKKKTKADVRTALLSNHCSIDQVCDILEKVDKVLDSPVPARSICRVFEEIAEEASVINLIKRSQNILIHMTGILYHRREALIEDRAKELVLLLEKSGIQDSEQWLDLLELTKCDATLCKLIAQKFSIGKSIKITHARIRAYISLLPHINKNKLNVHIYIESEPKNFLHLKELLLRVQEKKWMLRLVLYHEFRQPKPEGSSLDGTLQQLRCPMYRFHGQMTPVAVKMFPKTLQDLRISVANREQYLSLCHYLSEVKTHLPLLANFRLHLPAYVVDKELLQPLPMGVKLELIISKIDDQTVDWACHAASAMQPNGSRYGFLSLPGVGRSTKACHRLLEGLVREDVQMVADSLVTVSPKLYKSDAIPLEEGFKARRGCRFRALVDFDQ